MQLNSKSFVCGIAAALLILGCMTAVVIEKTPNDDKRFELHLLSPHSAGPISYAPYVVLDTQTGTAVSWRVNSSEPMAVQHFFEPNE